MLARAALLTHERSVQPICAMAAAETLAGGVVLLVATPTRLFAYGGEDGAASVEGALQRVPDVVELPGFADHKSELLLHVAAADGGTGDALRYAWMAAPGVYHGELRTSGAEAVSALEHDTNGSGGVLAGGTLLSYPAMESSPPLSIAATEFHFAVLWEDRLAVINRLSERVAFEETLSRRYELRTEGAPLGFAVACGDLQDGQPPPYAFTPRSLLVLRASNEGGDIWRALLGRGDYEAALARCSTQAQRAVVLKARADACFAAGDYSVAADYYARGSEAARFEEVTLAFLEAGQPDALRAYLLHRLDALPRTDRSQITMLVTWLLELYLDKAARLQQRMAAEERAERHAAASAAGGVFETLADDEEAALCARPRLSAAAAHAACVDELRAFLADHHASLDVRVASSLLASYGREDELILLAEARGDIEAAVWFHLDRGTTKQALSALRRPSASAALRVRAAPRLMELDPAGAVDLWMEAGGKLEPRELLPALARLAGDEMAGVASADGADGFEAGRAEAVRYLEYAVLRLRCRDDVVHTLLLTMYVRLGDEARLMRYLTTPGVGESVELSERTAAGASSKLVAGPTTPYDARLALRLCRQAGMMRACVHIYCALGMFEEAVGLALGVSVELAKAVASQPDEGSPLRKKLWLRVARHVVEQGDTGGGSAANGDGGVGIEATPERFSVAMSFLKDAGGLLKVEDILPFFPDFVMIDNFKDAICASVEEYSDRIDELKLEMEEDTRRAEAIRADEERLAQRCVAVGEGAPCARCGQPVGQHASTAHAPNGSAGGGGNSRQPVYAFPDGTVYLRDCLLEEAIPHLGKTQSTRAIAIRVQMTTIGAAAAWAPPHMVSRVPTDIAALGAEELEDALGSIIGAVNPRVSEMAIKAITEPFVGSAADADAWAV